MNSSLFELIATLRSSFRFKKSTELSPLPSLFSLAHELPQKVITMEHSHTINITLLLSPLDSIINTSIETSSSHLACPCPTASATYQKQAVADNARIIPDHRILKTSIICQTSLQISTVAYFAKNITETIVMFVAKISET